MAALRGDISFRYLKQFFLVCRTVFIFVWTSCYWRGFVEAYYSLLYSHFNIGFISQHNYLCIFFFSTCHDKTEILLKVLLNTIILTLTLKMYNNGHFTFHQMILNIAVFLTSVVFSLLWQYELSVCREKEYTQIIML
jgi:hypothetical protein